MLKKFFSGLIISVFLLSGFIGCQNEQPQPNEYSLKDLILDAKDGDTIDLGSVKFTAAEKESFTIKQKNLTLKNGNVQKATFTVEGENVTFQNLTDIYTVIVDEKIGDTDFSLKNCYRVEKIYLNGGGSKSVHIGNTEIGELVANKENLHIQFDDDGTTKIEKAFVFKDCSLDSKSDDNSVESIVISESVSNVELDGTASINKIISTTENASDIKITVGKDISIASADNIVKESIASNEENKEFNEKQETIKDVTLTEEEKEEIKRVKEDAGIKDKPKPPAETLTGTTFNITTAPYNMSNVYLVLNTYEGLPESFLAADAVPQVITDVAIKYQINGGTIKTKTFEEIEIGVDTSAEFLINYQKKLENFFEGETLKVGDKVVINFSGTTNLKTLRARIVDRSAEIGGGTTLNDGDEEGLFLKGTAADEPARNEPDPIEIDLNELIGLRTLNAGWVDSNGDYSYTAAVSLGYGSYLEPFDSLKLGDRLHLKFKGTLDKDVNTLSFSFLDNSSEANYWKWLGGTAYAKNIKAGETFEVDAIVTWCGMPVNNISLSISYDHRVLDEPAIIKADGIEPTLYEPYLDEALGPSFLYYSHIYDVSECFSSVPKQYDMVRIKFDAILSEDTEGFQFYLVYLTDYSYVPVTPLFQVFNNKANEVIHIDEILNLTDIPEDKLHLWVMADADTDFHGTYVDFKYNLENNGGWWGNKLYLPKLDKSDIPDCLMRPDHANSYPYDLYYTKYGYKYLDDVEAGSKMQVTVKINSISKIDKTKTLSAKLYMIEKADSQTKIIELEKTDIFEEYKHTFEISAGVDTIYATFVGENAIIDIDGIEFDRVDD